MFRSTFGRLSRRFSTFSFVKSSYNNVPRKTLGDIRQLYDLGEPISMVTSHDFITSQFLDHAKVDINLIGDSLANTTLGYDDTNELTLDEFIYHVKSVQRGNSHSLLIADLPFGSFESSVEQATQTAIKLIQKGKIQGVKIEGGDDEIIPTIKKLVSIGIPVMGHVGLTPQKHNALGGYKLQGRTVDDSVRILEECIKLQDAGVFSIVLECIPNKLSQYITERLSIPTIGIGAGPHTSGQVLVISDLLGMRGPHVPKFVKQYGDFLQQAVNGIKKYQEDVKSRAFPNADTHGFKMKKEVLDKFREKAKDL